MNVGSLFSGIGGIELGFEREGFSTIWFVENNPYCQAVLRQHWPKAEIYGDITTLDFSKLERPDILTGGFPCQDISTAGKQAGIREGKRSSLWRYYAEAIRILRPRYALIENVPALTHNGLDLVLGDLAEAGYDAEWFTLSASQFGAPHKRERIFIIAYPNGNGTYSKQYNNESDKNEIGKLQKDNEERTTEQSGSGKNNEINSFTESACSSGLFECSITNRKYDKNFVANSNSERFQEQGQVWWRKRLQSGNERETIAKKPYGIGGKDNGWDIKKVFITDDQSERIQRFRNETLQGQQGLSRFKDVRSVEEFFIRPDIPQPLIRRGGNGLPRGLDSYIQRERIQAVGNAVVPQVAQFIARRLKELRP